ncbi:MAG: serine/threonine-protein phosphatase [Spirochaetaceae bacterium]|nr:MAG: serine/threonine-protein phosphatase [Spirochaetaceae bacterium]
MMLEIACISDVGLVRENNEDIAVAARTYVRDGVLSSVEPVDPVLSTVLGVADGVGGSNAGEVASRFVLEQLALGIHTLDGELDSDALDERVRRICAEAHQGLIRKGLTSPRFEGMATTATVLFAYRGSWYVAHAGDSRCYHAARGSLRQLSRDHTLREFTGNPKIPGNILVNCFGTQDEFFIDFFRVCDQCEAGDVFLLCSDGLSDMVSNDTILTTLTDEPDLATAAQELVSAAKESGGRDNITLVVARVL